MDKKDREITAILAVDGRISFSDLGRQVGLSTNAAAARVRKLEAAGIILGYRAVLAAQEADEGIEAYVDVRLQLDDDRDRFLAWVAGHPLVGEAAHVTGPWDYHLHVRVKDTAALDRFLRALKRDGGAAQTETRIALR
ncbi:Lrp/AsnC family leucine-responsive transcriptional regulator [Leifsonia sp. AK011]|uniref:Lrp/AsnC family transcriptional regulator n=1 Tax=Leifsonia sp. AK011 TaxID=2723075 RepID=UPI0015C9BF67|nr:Lrp/AsnC family transcriptional regulator [Leifsonia sp. AK011]NYF09732.1 Lrp/AsnC family leucine-responsive transcriptional regulator [Leifsonia sp. AK011]